MGITFITPTCNRSWDIVERCIKCVDAQTYRDIHQIICSDGPDDQLAQNIQPHLSAKRLYTALPQSAHDSGNSVREHCLKMAATDYICFLDDDNVIFPQYAEIMIAALDSTGADTGFAICRIVHFGPLPSWQGNPPKILTGIPVITGNIDTLQVVMKNKAIQAVGWLSAYGYYADGYTYEALAQCYKYVEVQKLLGIHI